MFNVPLKQAQYSNEKPKPDAYVAYVRVQKLQEVPC